MGKSPAQKYKTGLSSLAGSDNHADPIRLVREYSQRWEENSIIEIRPLWKKEESHAKSLRRGEEGEGLCGWPETRVDRQIVHSAKAEMARCWQICRVGMHSSGDMH